MQVTGEVIVEYLLDLGGIGRIALSRRENQVSFTKDYLWLHQEKLSGK